MNDDEEHLVVGRPAMPGALHLLASEQLVELDVVRVVEGTAGLFFFHLGVLRTMMPGAIQTVMSIAAPAG
jgi:hypothetical protein